MPPPRLPLARRAPALLTLVCGLLLAGYATSSTIGHNRDRLAASADMITFGLRERIASITETLYTLQSFYRASNYVSEDEFGAFSEQDYKRVPEVDAVFFVPADKKNISGFRARAFNGSTLPDRKPLDDLIARAAIEKTQDGVVLLPLEQGRIAALVYEDKIRNEHGAPLPGYYMAIIDQNEILAAAREKARDKGLDIVLNTATTQTPRGWFSHRTTFGLGGMEWQLDFDARNAALWRNAGDFSAPALILLLTFLATAYVNGLLAQREHRTRTFKLLRDAHEAARRADSAKNQFLANMSHEIRTPLNGILGMAGILQASDLRDDQHGWVRTIANSGQGLLGIVNDILDFFELDSETLRLESKPFDLEREVSGTIDALTHRAAIDDGIELLVEMRNDLPRILIGDAARTRQIVANLLGNALKFTRSGHVVLAVAIEPSATGDNTATLVLRVEDTGIGIPAEKQQSVFDKFTQSDEGSSRRYGGTGLGLSITKGLVNLMNGTITLDSAPGTGSLFTCRLPVLLEKTGADRPHPRGVLEGLHALILDTNPTAAATLSANLESLGVNCLVAGSPADIKMPVDIVLYSETTERIAPDTLAKLQTLPTPQSSQRAPLVIRTLPVVTAIAETGNRVPDGIVAALPKSLTAYEWKLALTRLVQAPSAAMAAPLTADDLARLRTDTGTTDKPFAGLPVLVVDDMNLNRLIMTKILRDKGCEVDQAANGLEALDAVRGKNYSYIFMDCHMPEMDGYQATRLIRGEHRPGTPAPVIIAVTADVIAGNRDKCLAAGMNDYLAKPVTPDRVAQIMREWLAPAVLPTAAA